MGRSNQSSRSIAAPADFVVNYQCTRQDGKVNVTKGLFTTSILAVALLAEAQAWTRCMGSNIMLLVPGVLNKPKTKGTTHISGGNYGKMVF